MTDHSGKYGLVGMGQKKVINRLKTMYALRNLVTEAYIETLQAGLEGKPTAWSMANWWEGDIILKAMGIEVVYPENYATIVASMGSAGRYLDLADADGFPSKMCGYARTVLGYTYRMMKELGGNIPPEAPVGGMIKPTVLVGSGAACDARFKWFQSLGRYLDTPQWVLELPHLGVKELYEEEVYKYSISFMVQELESFITFLERIVGWTMDWSRLEELVNQTFEIHKIFYAINELRKAKPCPMHSCDFWSSMPACLLLLGEPSVAISLYKDMYREVSQRVDNKVAGIMGEEKYRLVFAELPPWHSLHFFEDLAERGWNFVMESYAYHPLPVERIQKFDNPLEQIAALSFHFIHGCHENSRKNNISYPLIQPYLEYAEIYHCDGALLHPLQTCRMASSHLKSVEDFLKRRLMVPSMIVEGDIVDIRLFNPERTLAQAEAFENSMDSYRYLRNKKI